MRGVRRDLTENDDIPKPGEYGKHWFDGSWLCCPPGHPELLGGLRNHTVIEHEDGTISVSPSILISWPRTGEQWHGYLERGVWREV